MQPLLTVLARNGLSAPDGRALHAYGVTPQEMDALGPLLSLRIGLGQRLASTAQGFVLWAAELIRRPTSLTSRKACPEYSGMSESSVSRTVRPGMLGSRM